MLRNVVNNFLFPGAEVSYTYGSMSNLFLVRREEGATIPCLVKICPEGSQLLIIYSHANNVDLGKIEHILESLAQHVGAHVLAYEYPGYGKYEGVAAMETVNDDIRKIFDFATTKLRWPANRIILFGASTGCGPTTFLARNLEEENIKVAAVVTQSPFKSVSEAVASVVGGWGAGMLMGDCWSPCEDLQHYSSPILFIHGRQDEVFSVEGTEEMLMSSASDRKMFHASTTATHHEYDMIKDVCTPLQAFIEKHIDLDVDGIRRLTIPLEATILVEDVMASAASSDTMQAQMQSQLQTWGFGDISDAEKQIIEWRDHLNTAFTGGLDDLSSLQNLYRHIHRRILQFMVELKDITFMRNLWDRTSAPFADVTAFVRRCWHIYQPSANLDLCLRRLAGALDLYEVVAINFAGMILRLDEQNRLIVKERHKDEFGKDRNCIVVPLYVAHVPSFEQFAEWLILADAHSADQMWGMAETLAYDVVTKFEQSTSSPILENFVKQSHFPGGLHQVCTCLFGARWARHEGRIWYMDPSEPGAETMAAGTVADTYPKFSNRKQYATKMPRFRQTGQERTKRIANAIVEFSETCEDDDESSDASPVTPAIKKTAACFFHRRRSPVQLASLYGRMVLRFKVLSFADILETVKRVDGRGAGVEQSDDDEDLSTLPAFSPDDSPRAISMDDKDLIAKAQRRDEEKRRRLMLMRRRSSLCSNIQSLSAETLSNEFFEGERANNDSTERAHTDPEASSAVIDDLSRYKVGRNGVTEDDLVNAVGWLRWNMRHGRHGASLSLTEEIGKILSFPLAIHPWNNGIVDPTSPWSLEELVLAYLLESLQDMSNNDRVTDHKSQEASF